MNNPVDPVNPVKISPDDRVRVSGRYELGIGEVLRLSETGADCVADVVFESRMGRRLETLPIQRLEKAASPWDKLRAGQFDIRYGKKQQTTQNYRLMEALQGHTRDLLFLSATPHQGDNFQFWSLVNLLDNHLFDSPEAMISHRSLLNRVMIRRTKREVVDANGKALFVRRQVHTESFEPALREQRFTASQKTDCGIPRPGPVFI
ncbi:MAG: hypothetical protein WCO56_27640 [Verrucomicrobiota bacterium]